MSEAVEPIVADVHRRHYREIVAPLIRVLGSFEAAEDVVQDAFASALEVWGRDGVPDAPIAWLRRVAKNRAIDRYRRQARAKAREPELLAESEAHFELELDDAHLADDALRLVFTCCHPSLAQQAQIALTLRTVCGLTTEQVARAFLVKPTTLQQRIVRAKRKIDSAGISYVVPEPEHLPPRLSSVLRTVYLVFNEGYGAAEGAALIRRELCEEGIRLGRLLVALMPEEAEPKALLALMLLHHSRRAARTDAAGDLVTLEDQDRARWDHPAIEEALPLVEQGLRQRPVSTYAIEAAVAALHARADRAEETDWAQIAALYGELSRRAGPSPVVALNAAVAVAMAGDYAEGLRRLDALEAEGVLEGYHLLPAARGDLLRRQGQVEAARAAYRKALDLVNNEVERRFLEGRLRGLDVTPDGARKENREK